MSTSRAPGFHGAGPERSAAKSKGPALSALLNCRASLSSDMALRIEKAFGPKIDTLLRMQTAYEIAAAREGEGKIKVKRYVAKPQPALVSELG